MYRTFESKGEYRPLSYFEYKPKLWYTINKLLLYAKRIFRETPIAITFQWIIRLDCTFSRSHSKVLCLEEYSLLFLKNFIPLIVARLFSPS